MLKIITLADTHMQFPDLPEGDILIIAGDFTYLGKPEEIRDNQKWLDSQRHKFKHIVCCSGNHDWGFNKDTFTGVSMLFDEEIEVEGLRIYGTPYTPNFCNWAFMKSEAALANIFAKIPEGLDVLITHGPPKGILDKNMDGESCGSTALRDRLMEMEKPPRVHCFGHIHLLGRSMCRNVFYKNINFWNVSYVSEWYKSLGEITEILI